MNYKTVIINVDGDNQIGLGHVYRAINLAKALKKIKIKVFFITKSNIVKKLAPKHNVILLTKTSSLEKIISEIKPNVIVIDKLHEQSKMIKSFKKFAKVIAIDYIGENKSLLDIGINMLYPISGIKNCNSYSGLEYSILNQRFQNEKPIRINKTAKRLLIIQGGSDTPCFTPRILGALNDLDLDIKITIVLGPAFKCWNKLDKAKRNSEKPHKIFHNVKNMNSLMKTHDIAITGGGMTLLEFSRLGIPSIVICGAKFENETAKLLEKNGFGVNLGFNNNLPKRKLISAVKNLITDYKTRQKMNTIGPRLVDGKGAHRVAQIIGSLIV
jgi:UDP-2,4-diacetamido-2,4,6-trideoxy-beta-L-altropyranose hydrolase